MSKTEKLSATQIAYLNYLAGNGDRPRCSIGTIRTILVRRGLAELQDVPGHAPAQMLVLTDAGHAAIS